MPFRKALAEAYVECISSIERSGAVDRRPVIQYMHYRTAKMLYNGVMKTQRELPQTKIL